MPGLFIAVVGPSGAGKDTLLDIAKHAFAGRSDVHFVRRVITRAEEAGGEDHEAVSDETFAQRLAEGRLALSWTAHGLSYGISSDVLGIVGTGICAIANLSRGALGEAATVFGRVRVIHVTAPDSVLTKRLAARGRESADEIAGRLARARYSLKTELPLTTVVNDRSAAEGGSAFVAALQSIMGVSE